MNTRMLGRVLFSAAIVGASLCAWPPDVRAQNPPWGVVAVRPAPVDFSYTVEQVYFKQPWSYKNMASKIEKAMVAIKVTIYGRGFKEQDTGPVVWWNRVRHQAIRVSPDGDIVEAYFFHPYKEFEQVG